VKSTLRRSFLFLAAAFAMYAGDPPTNWNKVADGPLEMYTASDPKEAAQLLASFARMRFFFTQAAPFAFSDQSHLAIIAFRSEKEFMQYRMNAGSCAFYQQTPKGEYVVLQDLAAEHREVTLHEFTHFVIAHTSLRLPLWTNEGVADLYSTLFMDGENATIGKPVPGRLQILRHRTWLPLNTLFEVGTTSDYYSEPDKMVVFYSESWALAHMLALSPEYSAHFAVFLKAISEGHSSADSVQSVYHKTIAQLEADLHTYVEQSHLPLLSIHVGLPPPAQVQMRVSTVSNSEIDVALSDLSLSNPNSKADIQSRLTTAANRFPENAQAEEALGSMALRQGNMAEARAHFRKAVDRHSNDPSVLFYLAHLDHEAGVPSEQVLPLLRQALAAKPNYYDALLDLALMSVADHDYSTALDSLTKLGTPRPEHAYTVIYSKAYCLAQTEKFEEARKYAAQAKALAATDADKAEVASLLTFISDQQQSASN
jgi:Flp pilus assembly protein TadD